MKIILYPARIENKNLGDILINGLLIRELTKSRIIVLKGTPSDQLSSFIEFENPFIHNIVYIHPKHIWEPLAKIKTLLFVLKNVNNMDFVFDTPGHLSDPRFSIKSLLKNNYELLKVIFYKLLNIKYAKYGVTVGPYSSISWIYQKLINKLSYSYGIRDIENLNMLNKRGFKNLIYIPDLAYLLYGSPILNYSLIDSSSLAKQPYSLISVRDNIIGHKPDLPYFRCLTEFILESIKQLSYTVECKNVVLSFQVDYDKNAVSVLYEDIKETFPQFNIILIDRKLGIEEVLPLYRNANLVLTNRLHVFLLVMLAQGKSVMITDVKNHQKVSRILTDSGFSDLLLDIFTKSDVNKLITAVSDKNAPQHYNSSFEKFNLEIISKIQSLLK